MNWIESKVRQTSVNRLLLAAACVVIVAMVLAAFARYFSNFFAGPYTMPRAELAAANDAEALPRYWVTLAVDDLIETGFQEITVRKKHGVERSREVSANYFVARIDERLLLVKAHGDQPGKSMTGYLKPITGKVDVGFFDDPAVKKLQPRFYPLMLDTADFTSSGQIGLWVAGLAVLGAAIYALIAFRRLRNPAAHPAMAALAQWGDAAAVGAMVENECKGNQTLRMGGYIFTPTFAVRDEKLNFELRCLDDLVWCYKQVTQKKLYGIIPTGKTFAVALNWANESLVASGKEPDVDAVLNYLGNYKPWVLLGHSDDLEKAYKKQRKELIALVAQRHREVLDQSARQAEAPLT